jgi:hypothetical protein
MKRTREQKISSKCLHTRHWMEAGILFIQTSEWASCVLSRKIVRFRLLHETVKGTGGKRYKLVPTYNEQYPRGKYGSTGNVTWCSHYTERYRTILNFDDTRGNVMVETLLQVGRFRVPDPMM